MPVFSDIFSDARVIGRVFCFAKSAPDNPERSATDGDSGDLLTARTGAAAVAAASQTQAVSLLLHRAWARVVQRNQPWRRQLQRGQWPARIFGQKNRLTNVQDKITRGAQPPKRPTRELPAGGTHRKSRRRGKNPRLSRLSKMLGPSGEFVELRVSGVRRLQKGDLPSPRGSKRRAAAPPHCTVGSPRTPAPHTGTSCRSTSCGRD